MSQASRRAARTDRTIAVGLLCSLGCFASGCKLHSAATEKLGDIASQNDGGSAMQADGAAISAPSQSANDVTSMMGAPADAGAARTDDAADASGAPARQDSGSGTGPRGQAGAPGTPVLADGGTRSPDDAGDAQSQVDDVTCALDYSTCLLLDPLGYAECTRKSAERCDLFQGATGMTADGGAGPSQACVLEEAACIMNNPADFASCMAMLSTCAP